MKNVLILNGHQYYPNIAEGKLTQLYIDTAEAFLQSKGFNVKHAKAESDYNALEEVEKFKWADFFIIQYPVYWMGTPWIMKKYIDEVFTIGHGRLYASDGRSRRDAAKKYGSGGLLQGRKHMLSLTWNAPLEAFIEPDQFFNGTGVDNVYMHFHRANEFLGTEALPTFLCNDVIKAPDVPKYTAAYQAHLQQVFGRAG